MPRVSTRVVEEFTTRLLSEIPDMTNRAGRGVEKEPIVAISGEVKVVKIVGLDLWSEAALANSKHHHQERKTVENILPVCRF